MTTSDISIFIADDYPLIREGLKKVLRKLPNVFISGESEDIIDLPIKISTILPDILIMELTLCEKPVKELIIEIKKTSPKTKVLIISDCACEIPVITSIRSGISGFLRKNVSEEELLNAVNAISKEKEYFASDITTLLVKSYGKPEFDFSIREMEILRYICKGRSNEQIADLLFISEKTVATHRKNIMRKAKVKKSSDLIVWALNNKIV